MTGTARHALHHREAVMGTVVTIDVYTADGSAGPDVSRGLTSARAILQRADTVFSTWKPDSPVSRLRRGEIALADAPAVITQVLQACAAARTASGGWFDPWVMPGGLDPTGLVKGWAAQQALAPLRLPEVSGAIVNAAGDIASFGALGPHMPFRIGIADPFAPRRLAAVVRLRSAIATSGGYERGEHLIDPHTGSPAARVASATVTGQDLGLADALATALAVAGESALALLGPLDGYEGLVISHDGGSQWTKHFPFSPEQ